MHNSWLAWAAAYFPRFWAKRHFLLSDGLSAESTEKSIQFTQGNVASRDKIRLVGNGFKFRSFCDLKRNVKIRQNSEQRFTRREAKPQNKNKHV